ncbi:MAG TPA: alkaline phosphatase family protein, partial [Usitatibacteraceae bacterium]|nr:alkaline phosphatase family protein [Usitatibacteraceae bacterium]
SVTVIDLASGKALAEVVTGLHASALAVSPDGRHVVCANAASDTLSVIDTRSDAVVETVWAKPSPSDLFGAQPNALAFDPSGRTLYVANGTQNAVAVVAFDPRDRESKLQGLIPVGWFPGALVFDAPRRTLHVANIKGHPTTPKPDRSGREAPPDVPGFNSHHYHGSLSLVPVPADSALPALSETVWRNLRRERIADALLPARPGQPARAVPERIGEPSLIKHVVYVIKENRTYDQVLGDVAAGNGDPSLCLFGARVTPNQHELVREFVLLDNTYCAGILSADGHQWSTTAIGTDYLERSFAGWPRSYPDGMGEDEADALAYSPAGFLWDNALRHGVSLRNYGEFMAPAVKWRDPKKKGTPDFLASYRTWKGESDEAVFASEPMIETIRPFSPAGYVGWEMSVPDQFRADFILRELKEFEAKGEFPALTIICLPNDHTSGTKKGAPTPAACMADNDLAFGRIVEALSRSRFWKEMAIFGIEDDPQAGWDHVSGYRTTAYVISPFAKRKSVVSTQYNTTSIIRTIEQILGLPVMNQFDASATPMTDAFTETPDFTPFTAVPANVPLDQMNPDSVTITDPALRRDALAYSPAGFLWDNALRHGVRIRNYGEFMAPAVRWRDPRKKGTPPFLVNYRTWRGESDEAVFESYASIETIRPFSPTAYVGWEMAVPDQYRADFIIGELKECVARGELPQLTIICLPNDHTSGTSPGSPTPAATVADNDLAFGRIVEALSHSPFWREMAIFAIEDDPQNGFDHVSGYRTTAYLASPYAKRGQVVSTQYNTTSLLRTLEQILGLPPMNQFDASAVPMWDAFTDTPDYAPFVAVPTNVPLDEMNPPAEALADPVARRDALASARMNFREVDRAPEDALNRVLWRAVKGTREPYPEWAITAVAGGDDE